MTLFFATLSAGLLTLLTYTINQMLHALEERDRMKRDLEHVTKKLKEERRKRTLDGVGENTGEDEVSDHPHLGMHEKSRPDTNGS